MNHVEGLVSFFTDIGLKVTPGEGKRDSPLSFRLTGDLGELLTSFINRPYFSDEGEWSFPDLFLRGDRVRPGLLFCWFSEDMKWCRWYPDTSRVLEEPDAHYIEEASGWEIPEPVTSRGWANLVNHIDSLT